MINFPKTQDATQNTAIATGAVSSAAGFGSACKTVTSIMSKQKAPAVAFAALGLVAVNVAVASYTARMSCDENTTQEVYLNKVFVDATETRSTEILKTVAATEQAVRNWIDSGSK